MWRSIRPPLYPPIKNVPTLVSHDMMEGNQHTNKLKAMEDDDATATSNAETRQSASRSSSLWMLLLCLAITFLTAHF